MSDQLISDSSLASPTGPSAAGARSGAITSILSIPAEFDHQAWRRSAACRDINLALFFPVGSTGAAIHQIAAAKSVCRECPVRLACLQYALETHQDDGVWGGHDEVERRELRRRRRRMANRSDFMPKISCGDIEPVSHAIPTDLTPEAS
jgi:WhiB family redox-sensing transcriptional regulator